jgi:hypothetical protein
MEKDDAIRAERRRFNQAIVDRDWEFIDRLLLHEYIVIPSFGKTCLGRKEMLDVYSAFFADPEFIKFSRIPNAIILSKCQQRASETGEWEGFWQKGPDIVRRSGTYQAAWSVIDTEWKLSNESYILLSET